VTTTTIVGIVLCTGSLAGLAWLRRSWAAGAIVLVGLAGLATLITEQRRVQSERLAELNVIRERCKGHASRLRSHAEMVREHRTEKDAALIEHHRTRFHDLQVGADALWGVCVDLDCPRPGGYKPEVMEYLATALMTGRCPPR